MSEQPPDKHPTDEASRDDPLSDRSADDTDTGWGDDSPAGLDDDLERYAEDRPPHWEA